MRTQVDQILFGSTPIHYRILRSGHRGTIAITVNPDASVQVVAPKGLRRLKISEVVRSKAAWILSRQERARRQHRSFPRQFVSGEAIYYLGRQYRLKVLTVEQAKSGERVVCSPGEFLVSVGASLSCDERARQVREAMLRWLKRRASDRLPEIVRAYATKLGVSVEGVQIRELKKRWGSGGPAGQLRFNWRIIMAPRRLVEYVVAHELCHLRHNDHSRDFWKLLGRVMPDFELRRSELERIGPKLDLPLPALTEG